MVAWSTSGAAVLATAEVAGGFSMAEAVGAFMVCAALITLVGATGWFERAMNHLPTAIASGLLAGVLARFGMQAFTAAQTKLPLVLLMLVTFLVGKHGLTRYTVPLILLLAILSVALTDGFTGASLSFGLALPMFTEPQFSWSAAIRLALPLFVVTMASQNLPGLAVITAAGCGRTAEQRGIPVSNMITRIGLVTLVLAPFGAYALHFTAITAAICRGREVHPDPDRRYTTAVSCGLLYILIGIFGTAITGAFTALPMELIAAIAGLALLGTIGPALSVALRDEFHCEAALITFLVTLSGVVMAGVGPAFWGVIASALALLVQRAGKSHLDLSPRYRTSVWSTVSRSSAPPGPPRK